MSAPSNQVVVRMYNVGFGDCFLLTFPGDDRPRKVLIDCGSHSAGRGPVSIGEIADRVVTDVTEEDGTPRIDVVVGTHRHQDHVSGFQESVWDEVEVSEVWMPWTEHPTDPEARRIREKQSRVARGLCAALAAAGGAHGAFELASNSLTNEAAMRTLHEGFSNRPRRCYLPHEEPESNSFATDSLPGVTIHAMGPARDPSVIRDMDPPAGGGYLRLLDEAEAQEATTPFEDEWRIVPNSLRNAPVYRHLRLSSDQMKMLDELSLPDHFQVAVALEKAVNGTSLMLMFELERAFLLFPGDAQWGTWRAALDDERWRALLAKTVFYKVGHHGSHNATPREFVEDVLAARRPRKNAHVKGFRAAVSTRPIRMWKYIPKEELLAALHGTTRSVARSDVRDERVPEFDYIDDIVAETRIPIRGRSRRA